MAAIDLPRTALGSAPVAPRRGSIFTAMIGAFVAWNDARITRKALHALSDRELEDIGLARGDIDEVARRGL